MKRQRVNSNQVSRFTLAFLGILLIFGLRLIALRSDPFLKLDWSAGLMNDEGFNIHNARNLILFGHASTDEYNNMLFSPLYHFAQVGVFTVFGVGSVQARMISVGCSLLTLLFLWAGLKRAFDKRIAFTALLFLGLDHTNLLYNRMALMDTPAALLAVMAFYAFVRGAIQEREAITRNQKWLWLMACGALIALAVTVRTVSIYLLAVPFVALGIQIFRGSAVEASSSSRSKRRFSWEEFVLLSLAAFGILGLYFLLWYWPHHAEMTAMSHYYRARQIPSSFARLGGNLYNAALGDMRGLSTYLFHHTPVVFTLALLGLMLRPRTRAHPVETYLIAWLLLGWGMLAV
ncbi:MAG: glycosyltransferase family 39 protein, partial [Acidobacteriota bacterium]|nr:glycosyltransferase family 39 protein [Acidobacteriota bacterium]